MKTNVILDFALQQIDTSTAIAEESDFAHWCQAALNYEAQHEKAPHQHTEWQITLRIVDADEGKMLNQSYRHKEKATNVLSFYYDPPFDEFEVLDESVLTPDSKVLLQTGYGDIVLCAPIVIAEAKEQQKAITAHAAHLTVHATLHLLGYDHESEQEATHMESLEIAILQQLGFSNPYEEI